MSIAALLIAIVADEPVTLRNAPSDTAAAQAVLWRGDWLEVRGQAPGFLKVYDHRHERPGYVRQWQVRQHRLDDGEAPALRAVTVFLRDAAGMETLGIGYAAMFLRAAPAGTHATDVLDAIGAMADRLASQASRRTGTSAAAPAAALAGHLEVAAAYGVRFTSFEHNGRAWTCYDGDSFRRLLEDPSAAPGERARAALSLTRAGCADPAAGPVAERAWMAWRADVLARVDAATLPAFVANRIHLRRAEVASWQAFDRTRAGHVTIGADPAVPVTPGGGAAAAAERAVHELALVDRAQLAEEDRSAYDQTAVRVSASRWGSEPPAPAHKTGLDIELGSGQPGETCVRLVDRSAHASNATSRNTAGKALAERCTFGMVWNPSVRISPRGNALVVAVQPLPAWTELWVFHRDGAGGSWRADVLAPAPVEPDAGVVEPAGFSPDGAQLLIARDAWVKGASRRRFEVLAVDTLKVETWADSPGRLRAFSRWSAPQWTARTLALR